MAKAGFVDGVLRTGSGIWRRLAPSSVRSLATPVMAAVARRRVSAALKAPEPDLHAGPLIVSGFLSETRGVSQAARLTLAGLQAAGYAPIAHDLRPMLASGPGQSAGLPSDRSGGVWVMHVNAPEAMHALSYLDPAAWLGRYRIGYWVYELQSIPRSWVRISEAFHEIWAPSRFVADALTAAGIRRPVRVMPHPVAIGAGQVAADRMAFGIPAGDFAVLAMADLRSSAERKNLRGAIEIYRRAFPEAAPGRRLIVKVQSTDPHPSLRASLEEAAQARPDMSWINESLSSADTHKLIASSDVLLSPHRSEGFGLPLAEAFLFGVPALATGWSGNLDFMGELPELLIRHRLVPVRDPHGIYRSRSQSWAEPDIADAAEKLKALSNSPSLRAELAARGKRAVEGLSAAWSRAALAGTDWARWIG